jgi:GAF domain-containing protein
MPTTEDHELLRRQAEIARRTAEAFRRGDDLAQALREVLEIVRDTFKCTCASVQFMDKRTGAMESVASSGDASAVAGSSIALPLILNGRIIGVLKAEDSQVGRFGEDDLRVLSQIQQQITASAALSGYLG